MGHARGAVDVGGDRLQDRAQGLPAFRRAARHDGRAVERALLAAGNTCADEVDAARGHLLFAADGVGEVGVAAVDDDVAFVHRACQLVDDRVGGRAGLNHDDRLARAFERGDEILHRLRRHEVTLRAVGVHERVRLFRAAVVHRDRVAVAREVPGQVRAHHRESNDANIRKFRLLSHAAQFTAARLRRGGLP